MVLAQGTASVDETVAAPETEETPSAESAEAARAPRDRDVVTIAEFSYGAAGRNVLIAGRELQPEMAFPISNVLSSGLGLQAPTRVLVSVGSPVALYSPFGDGEVTVSFNDAGGEDEDADGEEGDRGDHRRRSRRPCGPCRYPTTSPVSSAEIALSMSRAEGSAPRLGHALAVRGLDGLRVSASTSSR